MAGNGKSTKAEVAARIDTVVTKLLRGVKRAEIIRYASETWNVDERQVQNYITRATKQIEEITQPRKEYEFALVRQRLEELYEDAFAAKNYNAALGALKQVAEMIGLNAPVKSDTTGDLTIKIKYEDAAPRA
jgi:Zn-dependent M32 family carboxypeptidase